MTVDELLQNDIMQESNFSCPLLMVKKKTGEQILCVESVNVVDSSLYATDASALGLGGILIQWQGDTRVLKPVVYFSSQTTPEEKHLHSYGLETLAVLCSLKKLGFICWGCISVFLLILPL